MPELVAGALQPICALATSAASQRAVVDPPSRSGDRRQCRIKLAAFSRGLINQLCQPAGADRRCPADLPITAGQRRQFEVSQRCTIAQYRIGLLGALAGHVAAAAWRGRQPARLAFLLAGKASKIMILLVATAMGDAMIHGVNRR